MKNVIFGVCAALMAVTPAFAGCNINACTDETVSKIYPGTGGSVFIITTGVMSNLDCTLQNGQNMTLYDSHPNKAEIYSLLLSAFMSDTPVTIRIVNGSPDCEIRYASATK